MISSNDLSFLILLVMYLSDLLKDYNNLVKLFEKSLKQKNKNIAFLLLNHVKEPRLLYRYANTFHEKLPFQAESIVLKDRLFRYLYLNLF
jgi:hypothetical protein